MPRHAIPTVEDALATLGRHKRVPYEVFAAIMELHVLEVPGLTTLRRNYDAREWAHLSGQLLGFAGLRERELLELVLGDTDRDTLRHHARLTMLLRELAQAAGEFRGPMPELGN